MSISWKTSQCIVCGLKHKIYIMLFSPGWCPWNPKMKGITMNVILYLSCLHVFLVQWPKASFCLTSPLVFEIRSKMKYCLSYITGDQNNYFNSPLPPSPEGCIELGIIFFGWAISFNSLKTPIVLSDQQTQAYCIGNRLQSIHAIDDDLCCLVSTGSPFEIMKQRVLAAGTEQLANQLVKLLKKADL